jgi:hypothetical protein
MKYLFAITISAFVTFGLSSCAKETCYECENTVGTITCTADICDGVATNSGNCGGSISAGSDNVTNENLKDAYEAGGYTCTAK